MRETYPLAMVEQPSASESSQAKCKKLDGLSN